MHGIIGGVGNIGGGFVYKYWADIEFSSDEIRDFFETDDEIEYAGKIKDITVDDLDGDFTVDLNTDRSNAGLSHDDELLLYKDKRNDFFEVWYEDEKEKTELKEYIGSSVLGITVQYVLYDGK